MQAIVDILLNCVAFLLPIKQAQWGSAGTLTWLSLAGTIVMMIVSIMQLAPLLRATSSIIKTDRMWSKMEAMEQEIAHHKEEIALHKEELALLKETDELHEARLDRLDA